MGNILVPDFHLKLQTLRERVCYDRSGQTQTYSKSIVPFVLKSLRIGLTDHRLRLRANSRFRKEEGCHGPAKESL